MVYPRKHEPADANHELADVLVYRSQKDCPHCLCNKRLEPSATDIEYGTDDFHRDRAEELLWRLAGFLALVVLTLFSVILPAFYLALYRNEAILYFPKRLRLLALIAAFTFAVIVLTTLPAWIRSLAAYLAVLAAFDWSIGAASVLAFVRDPRTIGQLSTRLGELSNIAYILMLIAVFRQTSDLLETDVPVSKQLRAVARVAVISWGLWVAFLIVRVIAMPYAFIQTRTYAIQIGRTPPLLWEMMAEAIRTLLIQTCLFAVPYIVYKSLRERAQNAIIVQSGPEPIVSGG